MRGFHANNCRLCPKVFCCKKCRLKHEKTFHQIFPDCDICVYGKFFLENIDDCFLQHLESSHLPVHCIRCKKVFGSVEELLQHKKCNYSQTKELSPKTPFRTTPVVVIAADDNDSPIFLESQRQEYLNCILATSTPMLRGEEPNQMFEKGKEVITPVDKPSRAANKSIIKKTDSARSEDYSKRRVTFGETSGVPPEKKMRTILPENQELLSENEILESLGQSSSQNFNGNSTPDVGMSTGEFYSAKTETAQCPSAKTDLSSKPSKEENITKNVEEGFTPDTGMSTRQFYSAKTDLSSKPFKDESSTKNLEGFTPDTGMSTGQFYSAKTDLSLKQFREERTLEERSTPVGIPARKLRKLINAKGDIYRKQTDPINTSLNIIPDDVENQDNLYEVPMELCTPANILSPLEEEKPSVSDTDKKDEKLEYDDVSPMAENIQNTLGNNHTNFIDFYTPAKTSNSGKITVKGDIYKETEENTIAPVVETSKQNELLQHKYCNDSQTKEFSPKTPFKTTPVVVTAADDHDSPIFLESQRQEYRNCILVTRTPIQKGEEPSQIFEKRKEVDESSLVANKSIIKKTDSAKSDDCSKRRVTFGEAPGNPPEKKIINTKEDDIYRKQNQPMNISSDISSDDVENQDNLNEVSMELCTPAKNLNPPEENEPVESDTDKQDEKLESTDDSSMTENIQIIHGNNHTNVIDFYTPAKTSNSGKITVKGNIYKETEENTISPVVETSKENESDDKSGEEISSENNQETNQNADATGHDTLWLSASNLEETNEFKIQNEENIHPEKSSQPTTQENTPEKTPPSPPKKRVSIVMPTPILKTTNVQMKFHFPAHLSSTPIMSSGTVKIKQTKIVKDLSTKVIQQQKHQTPYKTPQGRLCEMLQRKFGDGNLRRNLAILPDNLACSSSDNKQIVPLETINGSYSCSDTAVCKDDIEEPINTQYQDSYSSISREPETSVSVSSMTESNLWSSMTRIVKSVLGGFTSMSQDSSNTSSSYKRQLSDSETGDFLEAPCLKRFKFTDIKCRRAIRDLPALDLPRRLPGPASSLARIEIVKSVSTLYGPHTMKIHCDKATQTDNYLMYGWHPKV